MCLDCCAQQFSTQSWQMFSFLFWRPLINLPCMLSRNMLGWWRPRRKRNSILDLWKPLEAIDEPYWETCVVKQHMKQNKRVVRISYIKNHFAIKFSNATAVICKKTVWLKRCIEQNVSRKILKLYFCRFDWNKSTNPRRE